MLSIFRKDEIWENISKKLILLSILSTLSHAMLKYVIFWVYWRVNKYIWQSLTCNWSIIIIIYSICNICILRIQGYILSLDHRALIRRNKKNYMNVLQFTKRSESPIMFNLKRQKNYLFDVCCTVFHVLCLEYFLLSKWTLQYLSINFYILFWQWRMSLE